MKYIAITFDDGRSDNYMLAKVIMDKYHLRGTVYITTGFVDGTWIGKNVLKSPTRALSVDEVLLLYHSGWEIGLHGDKHQTQVDDMCTALKKLLSWGVCNSRWGISVPNSVTEEAEVVRILKSEYGNKIAYIRRGRKCNTLKFSNKLLYLTYSCLNSKWAYRRFNALNVFNNSDLDKVNIPSVVVKSNDKPEMIIDFIKSIPDDYIVVLMLHSILEEQHPLNGKDPWSWGEKKFERLCEKIVELQEHGILKCAPLIECIDKK